jgi:DNA-binding CsgD family transcriptional regulator/PAS domain-containing protein
MGDSINAPASAADLVRGGSGSGRASARSVARAAPRVARSQQEESPALHERMSLLLHEGALEPKRWRDLLELLGRQLRGAATLILRSPTIGQTGLVYSWGGTEEVLDEYATRYFSLDPFVQLPEKQVMTLHDFVPAEQLERSAFYREYLVPWDSIYHLGVDVRDEGRFYARLRVSRARREGDFSVAERGLVERLVPHLDTAIRTRAALDTARMERATYADAMDQLTLATVILDSAGHVIHTNALARELLAQQDGLALHKDSLVLANPADHQKCRDAIGRAIAARRAGQPGIVDVLRVRRQSGNGHYGMIIRPAAGRLGTDEPAMGSWVAVFVSTEEGQHVPPVETVRELFELTSKEAQLALCLANGRSLQEAARELGITLNTARAHLRSIFSKTGIDRQARLVRAILRSVAALGG